MIQMAECDTFLSLSLYPNGDDVGRCGLKINFATLLRRHLSNVVNVFDNVSATIPIL
jgi:hypothetical protein